MNSLALKCLGKSKRIFFFLFLIHFCTAQSEKTSCTLYERTSQHQDTANGDVYVTMKIITIVNTPKCDRKSKMMRNMYRCLYIFIVNVANVADVLVCTVYISEIVLYCCVLSYFVFTLCPLTLYM